MKTLVKALVPRPLRPLAKRMYYALSDWVEVATGRRDAMTPPARLQFVGYGDFRKIGQDFLRLSRELAGLRPDAHVLDVGCGIGRIAVPLTEYLSPAGAYDGFDVVADGIDWCRRVITRRFPRFRFQRVDVYNKAYNATGSIQPADFRFPYADNVFDFVILVSVFTHMLPADMEHYLAEITRVTKPGGRSLITYFLLNDQARQLMAEGKSTLDFRFAKDGFWTFDEGTPEFGVAYEEQELLARYQRLGWRVLLPVHYGVWCGRQPYVDYQDIVVAEKKNTDAEQQTSTGARSVQ